MSQFAGIATVTLNGRELNSKPGAKLGFGGFKRTTVVTDQKSGFSKAREAASVECDIVFEAGTSLTELAAADDVTITFKTDVGVSYVLANAWLENVPMLTAGEGGSVPLMFNANAAEEVGA